MDLIIAFNIHTSPKIACQLEAAKEAISDLLSAYLIWGAISAIDRTNPRGNLPFNFRAMNIIKEGR